MAHWQTVTMRLAGVALALLVAGTWLSGAALAQDGRDLARMRQQLVREAQERQARTPPPKPELIKDYERPEPPAELQGKVIGVPTAHGYFRDSIAIYQPEGAYYANLGCSGVMISDTVALTAAHCICDLGLTGLVSGGGARETHVYVGEELKVEPSWPNAARILRAALYDPDFCRRRAPGTDLALLFLNEANVSDGRLKPVPPGPAKLVDAGRFAPARLAPAHLLLSNALQSLYVVGFGLDSAGKSGRKNVAQVPIVSRICGSELTRAYFRCAAGREIVLAGLTGDTCNGDSGGGAYAVMGKDYYLVGITSRGIEASCGPGGIYTLITPDVLRWIRAQGVAPYAYD